MDNTNEMQIIFDSRPVNEGLARVTAAALYTAESYTGGGGGFKDSCFGGCDQLYYSCL